LHYSQKMWSKNPVVNNLFQTVMKRKNPLCLLTVCFTYKASRIVDYFQKKCSLSCQLKFYQKKRKRKKEVLISCFVFVTCIRFIRVMNHEAALKVVLDLLYIHIRHIISLLHYIFIFHQLSFVLLLDLDRAFVYIFGIISLRILIIVWDSPYFYKYALILYQNISIKS